MAAVACGDTHTLVVTEGDGALYTFGRNQNGQLGLGHTHDCLSPQPVLELQGERVLSVACGSEHSLAATERGTVYAWGWGRYGNLGDGESSDRYLPTRVHGLDGVRVVEAECGWRHSAVVTDAGHVYTFGWSKYGQLGHGDHQDHSTPCLVAALSHCRITRVAGGWRHTVAADSEGRLYAWGWNKFGQLGLGDTEDRCLPTPVAALAAAGERVALLACGWRHTLAVADSGAVYSWGRGVNGQLGHGVEQDLYQPTLLAALSHGTLSREGLLAASDAMYRGAGHCGYVAPEDRYAVVPGADEPYGNGGTASSAAAAAAAVPSMAGHGGQGGDRSPKKARMGGEDGWGSAM